MGRKWQTVSQCGIGFVSAWLDTILFRHELHENGKAVKIFYRFPFLNEDLTNYSEIYYRYSVHFFAIKFNCTEIL
jgi:hypothetical protein